jgi:hypothetical protein
VKNRFQISPIKCNLQRYTVVLEMEVGLVTWTILAVINWCLRPYALLGLSLPEGVSDWLRGPYRLSSIGRVFGHTSILALNSLPGVFKIWLRGAYRPSSI